MSNQKITNTNCNTVQENLPLHMSEETNHPKKKSISPTFIPYNNQQGMIIFDIQDLIPEKHISRVIDDMIEAIDDEVFFQYYKGGGRSSYHPKMMTKIVLYGYSQKKYSCREIATYITENIPAMWLAAMQTPDFRTINDFRTKQMGKMMESLFEEMVHQLIDEEYITMDNYFLDGTKIEANANKYSFVWKKSTTKYEEKLKEKIQKTYQQIQSIAEEEAYSLDCEDSESSMTPKEKLDKIEEVLTEQIEQQTKDWQKGTESEVRKEKRKKLSEAKKLKKKVCEDFRPRLEKYEAQQQICRERNSYSKIDTDATFMRMKDDHMKNGQLKPGYNVQMATENQLILFYTMHQNPGDTRTFIPHLEKLKDSSLPFPKRVVADAGYGGEVNYLYAHEEEKEFEVLIPYSTMRKEQTSSYQKDIRHASNWEYQEHDDLYICPNNKRVTFKHYSKRTDKYGYTRDLKIYECEDCSECPFKERCTKAEGNRQVHYNPVYEEMKEKAKQNLWSDEGAQIYAQRKVEVESVFGHIKGNRSFRRFSLRGLEKVTTEFGIVAIAHNLLKVAGIIQQLSGKEGTNKKSPRKNISFLVVIFYF